MAESAADKKARLTQNRTWVIPDAFWQGLFTLISTIALAWISMQTQLIVNRAHDKVDVAIVKADEAVETVKEVAKEVIETAEKKLDAISNTTDQVHSLVNSDSLAKDKIVALVLKQLSLLTKDPKDVETARLAEATYEENLVKQKALNEKAFPKEKQP